MEKFRIIRETVAEEKNLTLRWITAAILICSNITVSYYIHSGISSLYIPGQATLFIPIPFVFRVWEAICCLFILYSVYQLLPGQHEKPVYEELAFPVIAANMLTVAWVICFRLHYTGFCMLLLFILLNLSFDMFRRIKQGRTHRRYSLWLNLMFSVYFGWVTTTNIININLWLLSVGTHNGIQGKTSIELVLIFAAFLSGVLVSVLYRDSLYPSIISLVLITIWSMNRFSSEAMAAWALTAGIILLTWTVVQLIKKYYYQKKIPAYNGRAVMKIVR